MGFQSSLKQNPKLKKLMLWLLFRRRPNSSRVRRFIWLFTIFPRYFNHGIIAGARLDLVPFHKFKLGKNSRIEKGTVVANGMGDVIIHEEVHTGIGCILLGPLEMHKHVTLAQYVRVNGMHHGLDVGEPHHFQPCFRAPIVIEEDAFVGTGTVILGKKNGETLTIGKYSRIGANAVIVDDVPPYSVVVGNPAKVVREWDFKQKKWVAAKSHEKKA
ncbi:MAG: acyltransferase [Candidatus Zhuqueibacterota bacterium]